MELASLDLNLLVVLDAVLSTRHVTRAARKLGLSQSAVSHALARLREALGDELLVRGPTGLLPTARGEALQAPLREVLDRLGQVLEGPRPFDPTASDRTFQIGMADYGQFVLLPPLLARFQAEAPRLNLWITAPAPEEGVARLASGELDLLISVPLGAAAGAGLHERTLFEEQFVCVVRADRTDSAELTLEQYTAARHVFIAPRGLRGGAVDTALGHLGLERHIALAVPHFLVVPHVIAGSDLIVTLASRVAHAFATHLPLRILPPPLDLPGFRMVMTWHDRSHRDPGHTWLRTVLASVGAGL